MSTQNDLGKPNDAQSRTALLQMITGFWVSQAIHVAAKLGIADVLQDGAKSSEELAESFSVSPRELFRLLRFLASLGIFAETQDGRFELTPLARGLQTGAPGSLRAMAIMYGEEIYRAWGDLMHSIRTGETAFDHVFGSGHIQYMAQHPAAAAVFNQAMTEFTAQEATAVIRAYDFARFDTIVDVGGGKGSFLTAILKANPAVQGVLFELPHIAHSAQESIETAGLAGRCQVAGGDFFVTVPSGGDAYILKNIILNWDDDQSVAILTNCRRAMAEQGRLLVIESVILPPNVPSFSKLLDLHMLVVTGGQGRSQTAFRALLAAAGFELLDVISTRSSTSVIEAAPI